MKGTYPSGNYALLEYVEPKGTRRYVASFVLEHAVTQDVHAALTQPDAAAWWASVESKPEDGLCIRPPGSPSEWALAECREFDGAEFSVPHRRGVGSRITVTLAPGNRITVVAAVHAGIPADAADEWRRFWCGPVFRTLGDVLASRGVTAGPALMKRT